MSKNQRSAILRATKKPNSVFRRRISFPIISAGTKLSSNLQSQNIEEPTPSAFAFRSPVSGGISNLDELPNPSTHNSQLFSKNFANLISGRLSLTEDPLLAGSESSAINVPVNTLFSQSLCFLRRLPICTPARRKKDFQRTTKLAGPEHTSTAFYEVCRRCI